MDKEEINVKKIIEQFLSEESNPILLYNIGKNNEIFELIRLLKNTFQKMSVCHDFSEFIIQSLYEKKSPTENLLQGDIELFVISNVECLSNKPSHISELKKLIDELVTNKITVLCSCHDIIPADVKTIFENYNSKIVNMKEELTI